MRDNGISAIARSEYTNTGFDRGFSELGIEATALRLLAVRIGSKDRFYGGSGT